jgi:DNA-binding CsgD family transcriptional regulator
MATREPEREDEQRSEPPHRSHHTPLGPTSSARRVARFRARMRARARDPASSPIRRNHGLSIGMSVAPWQPMDQSGRLWAELVRGEWAIEECFDDAGVRVVIARRSTSVRSSFDAMLSTQERLVLSRVAAGHSNKLVAHDLGLSVSTVASYLRRASAKLGVRSRVELVRAFWSDA